MKTSKAPTTASEKPTTAQYEFGMRLVRQGMSIRKSALKTGVPRENLRKRVREDVPVECRTGPQLVYLSAGANIGLHEIVGVHAKRGMCIGLPSLSYFIRQAALVSSLRPVPESFPSRKFVQRWRKKHSPWLSLRKARILEGKRAEGSTEDAVKNYFGNLEAAVSELGLGERPA
ncbi:hypothetical protein PInf_007897 [Phytophthora infestans]|nr:hypothetical protein PInf_007897 [Phytophthora infestans]